MLKRSYVIFCRGAQDNNRRLTTIHVIIVYHTRTLATQIWLRCVIALAYGSYIGIKGINSPTQLIQIFNLLAFVPVMYCRMYLGVDSESFGSKIMLSGLLNAVALALLMWIYFFTAAHETEEAQLKTLLASLATSAAQTVAGGGETNAPATGKSQESEF